jgi:glycosyltransferase involved in cell wall biosynthesis
LFGSNFNSKVIALNENKNTFYDYKDKVERVLISDNLVEYKKLAEYINNQKDVSIVMIEHEFGLFGGNCGNYLLEFLKRNKKKVFITLHTVLSHPDQKMKDIVHKMAFYSTGLVVMNEISKNSLQKFYDIEKEKIKLIFHGVPQVEFNLDKEKNKEEEFKNKTVLLTFGLLSPNKGVEYTIKALPQVVKRYPNLIFLLVGKTHPGIINKEREKYRNYLKKIVKELNLEKNVIFYNKYCSLKKLISYLEMCNIYISSSLDPNQSVSGTISYALGTACPIISTKNEYAKFVINKENGALVSFKNSEEIIQALLYLLKNKKIINKKSFFSYRDSRKMIWPNVARSYLDLYKRCLPLKKYYFSLPKIKLNYIQRLTDSFGMIQFALFTQPDKKSGYTLDDNCRALLLCSKIFLKNRNKEIKDLMKIYLDFIEYVNKKDDFFNIVDDCRELKEKNREDVLGRLIMSLSYIISKKNIPKEIFEKSFKLWKKGLKHLDNFNSPRAIAFSVVGLSYFLEKEKDIFLEKKMIQLSEKLCFLYKQYSTDKWNWFEEILSYSNAILPQALFRAYKETRNILFLEIAKKSLDFLLEKSFQEDKFYPIGQRGWLKKDLKMNFFDQQPEEVSTMVLCLIDAYQISSEKKYKDYAIKIFNWFLGENHLKQMVYDINTGGCCDGLGENSLNFNQGAESTIMYLLARLEMEKIVD